MVVPAMSTATKDEKLQQLETEALTPLLLRYSLPAVIGMCVMSLYNLIDAFYVGRWCGTEAIAALALVFPIMNITFAVGTLVGLGCAATTSIALGKGDKERAFRVLGHGVLLSLIFGFSVGWGLYLFLPQVLLLFGASEATYQPAYDFMSVILLAFPVSTTYMNLNHLMRASGYPKKAMLSLLLSVGSNILLAPLFIYVFGWGMWGAAMATALAQFIGLSWVLLHYLNPNNLLHFRRGIYQLCGPIMRRILVVGLPPCLVNFAGCLVVVCFNHASQALGGDMAVGAYGIINRFTFIFVMVVLGITQGMQPIVGYNLGLGSFERVRGTLMRAMIAGSIVTTLGTAICLLFPHGIIALFAKESQEGAQELISIGAAGIQLFVLGLPLVGTQVIITQFFQAIGRPALSIFLSLSRQLLFLLPLIFFLPRYWGIQGLWCSVAISDWLAIILGFTVISLFIKRNLNKRELPPTPHA